MNEMYLKFPSLSENEVFARNAVAAFVLPLNPTLTELSDVKTAVSEAVTNAIVHGYGGAAEGWIELKCRTDGDLLEIEVADRGRGIEDVARALTPFFTTLPGEERSGMGFTIMQTFMSGFSVSSAPGEGTRVKMSKRFGELEANAG